MKGNFSWLKWVAGSIKPFLLHLIMIILGSGILSLCSVGIAIASKVLIDAAAGSNSRGVAFSGVILAALILSEILLQTFVSIQTSRTSEVISNHLQKRIITNLLWSEWLDSSRHHSGDIITRLTSDVNIVTSGITSTFPNIISLFIRMIAAFLTLLILEPSLAIIAFALGPAAILLSRLLGRKLRWLHVQKQETESRYRSFLQELIRNITVVKAFSQEGHSTGRMSELQDQRMGWALKRSRLEAGTGAVLSFGYWLGFFLAFLWGAVKLTKKTTSFGTFAAFLQLVEQIQVPFVGLTYAFPQLVSVSASAERLREMELLKREAEVAALKPVQNPAGVLFHKVSFSYTPVSKVLDAVSFEILPGEYIAVIGASGAGKTTLVRLLVGFVHPEEGEIRLHTGTGEEIKVGAGSRNYFSYVPQGNTLFSGSLEENVRYGDREADAADIERVLKAACAWDFVKVLPEGIHEKIGENGTGLSEGQAQRIAIARALLRKAPVLVLDEATSQLDVETEMKILQSIHELFPKTTCIIISHRKEVLQFCHRILLLENGRIQDPNPGEASTRPIEGA